MSRAMVQIRLALSCLLIRAYWGCYSAATNDTDVRKHCRISILSRPDAEYNLCGLDGDQTIAVPQSEWPTEKALVQTGSENRQAQGHIQLNLFDAILRPEASPLETDCVANSTVCYIRAPRLAVSRFRLSFLKGADCSEDEAYSFGMNSWDIEVRSSRVFQVDVPQAIFSTTGPVCESCNIPGSQIDKVNNTVRLKTLVKLYCDERYNEGKVLKQVEMPKKASEALKVKLYTKQSCPTYKNPKPSCINGLRVVCPFHCTSTRGDRYSLERIKPKKYVFPGSERTFFFRLCYGMRTSSPQSECNSNDTIICERTCNHKPSFCERRIVSRDDDIEIELIPDGFVWHVYSRQVYSDGERVCKAIISFHCDELLQGHEFKLTQPPSQTFWFSLRGPCVCRNASENCADFVPTPKSSFPGYKFWIAVGVVVFGVVALLIGVFVFLRKQKKQRKQKELEERRKQKERKGTENSRRPKTGDESERQPLISNKEKVRVTDGSYKEKPDSRIEAGMSSGVVNSVAVQDVLGEERPKAVAERRDKNRDFERVPRVKVLPQSKKMGNSSCQTANEREEKEMKHNKSRHMPEVRGEPGLQVAQDKNGGTTSETKQVACTPSQSVIEVGNAQSSKQGRRQPINVPQAEELGQNGGVVKVNNLSFGVYPTEVDPEKQTANDQPDSNTFARWNSPVGRDGSNRPIEVLNDEKEGNMSGQVVKVSSENGVDLNEEERDVQPVSEPHVKHTRQARCDQYGSTSSTEAMQNGRQAAHTNGRASDVLSVERLSLAREVTNDQVVSEPHVKQAKPEGSVQYDSPSLTEVIENEIQADNMNGRASDVPPAERPDQAKQLQIGQGQQIEVSTLQGLEPSGQVNSPREQPVIASGDNAAWISGQQCFVS